MFSKEELQQHEHKRLLKINHKTFLFSLILFLSVLSLIMMVVIRYISKVLVWILTVLVIVGSIGNHRTERSSLT